MVRRVVFEKIQASERKPLARAEFNLKLANKGLGANRQPILLLAPKLATGTQAAATPVAVYSDEEVAKLAGRGSIAHEMSTHILKTNRKAALSISLVEDPADGTQATATITYAGTIIQSGTEYIYVGDQYIEAVARTTDTPATLAASFADKINAKLHLPVTASAAGSTLTLTFRHKGAIGNALQLNAGGTTEGLSRTVEQMAGGQGSHDVQEALDAAFAGGDKLIASAFNDLPNLYKIRQHVDTCSDETEIRGVRAWFATTGSVGAGIATSYALNAWLVHHALLRYGNTANGRSSHWAIAAAKAAMDAWEEDPAMPLNTLELPTIAVPDKKDCLSSLEQTAMLWAGVTPLEAGPGNKVQIVRAITTYTRSAAGGEDPALLDITTPKTLFYFREQVVNDQKIRYGRGKFTARRAKSIVARAYEIAKKLEDLEILQNVDKYKSEFVWEPHPQNVNMMALKIPAPVVPGLHIIGSQFVLYVEPPEAEGSQI